MQSNCAQTIFPFPKQTKTLPAITFCLILPSQTSNKPGLLASAPDKGGNSAAAQSIWPWIQHNFYKKVNLYLTNKMNFWTLQVLFKSL